MFRLVNILFLSLLFPVILFGQGNRVDLALKLYQEGQVDKAKSAFDDLSQDNEYKGNPTVWFWKGYIEKELYKQNEKDLSSSPLRLASIKSLYTSMELDIKNEHKTDAINTLNYLSSTLYNDVVRLITPSTSNGLIDDKSIEQSIENFDIYLDIKKNIDPQGDYKGQITQFNIVIGQNFMKKFEAGNYENQDYMNQAILRFQNVLDADSNHVKANYNMALIYYNKSVYMINNMDYDRPIEALNEIIDETNELFKKALPYMIRAYKLEPKRKETLKGLAGIYWSLNDKEKSELYFKQYQEIDSLEKQEEKD